MKAVTGVFHSRSDAERAVTQMRSLGVSENKITLLTPDKIDKDSPSVPSVSGEQPGMGRAIGSVVGAVTGFSGGALVMAAIVPGIGLVTAIGLLGGAVLAAAGASIGAVAGGKLGEFHDRGAAGGRIVCLRGCSAQRPDRDNCPLE